MNDVPRSIDGQEALRHSSPVLRNCRPAHDAAPGRRNAFHLHGY